MTQRIASQEKLIGSSTIAHIVEGISPFDDVEHGHILDTLAWIESGAPLFRIEKPDIPPKHLVSYVI